MLTTREACDWFDLDAADTDEVCEAESEIGADEVLAGLVEAVVRQLREQFEVPVPWAGVDTPAVFDPVSQPDAPAARRWLYVVAFAHFLPGVLEAHRRRGVPESVSRATFADVGRHARIAYRKFGVHCGYEQHWLTVHLRGLLYDLGRLQFNLARLALDQAQLDAAGIDATPGTVVLESHIPETGPLDAASVDAAFAAARPFFAAVFPEHGTIRYATCDSWLLDPQLAQIVPDSNIARFGARFRLFDTSRVADQSALDFVFRAPTTPLDQLPRDTRLQRGMIDHLASGGHVEQRYGWLALPGGSLSTR